jgi:hypothetical protein
MSMDTKTAAQLLATRQKELDAPLKALGGTSAETALEKILYRRPVLPPSVMRTGRVPALEVGWLTGALGEMRLKSRSASCLTFEVCLPANAEAVLQAMKMSGTLPDLDLRVAAILEVKLPLQPRGPSGGYTVWVVVRGVDGKELNDSCKVDPDLAVATNLVMEALLNNGSLTSPDKAGALSGAGQWLADGWQAPVSIGFLGFLYCCYGALVHGLYDDTLMTMGAWLFGGLLLGFFFRLFGAATK